MGKYSADDMIWTRTVLTAMGIDPDTVNIAAVMDEAYVEWTDMADGETGYAERDDVDLDAVIARHRAPVGYRFDWVGLDGGCRIAAFVSTTERWNGWAVPLFTREALIEAREELQDWFDGSDTVALRFDADGFPSLDDLEYGEGDHVAPVVIDGRTLYDVGGRAWVWSEIGPECPNCGETVDELLYAGKPYEMCGSCDHDARRSGWEPGL